MTAEAARVPLLVVTNEAEDRHDTGEHPECGPRTEAALHGLQEAQLGEALRIRGSREATTSELVAVHAAEYVASLEQFCGRGGGNLDQDTPVVVGSWSTALHAAGAGLLTVEALDRSEADAGFVITRPPGHHARPQRGMGFCLFNNVAVTAANLANRGERVLIVDWDVHHGNGTQEAFWDDDRVLFVSLHQYPYYPGTGSSRETGGPNAPGLTINVPLQEGATGDVYLEAFDTLIAPAAQSFAPTWVLVSAGFDAHRDDPLADLRLTSGDYADLTRRMRSLASGTNHFVMFLEGGYDLQALSNSVGACAAVLCDGDFRPEDASNGGPGQAGIRLASEAHRLATW